MNKKIIILFFVAVLSLCSCTQDPIDKFTVDSPSETVEIANESLENFEPMTEKNLFLSAVQVSDMFINAYQNINIEKMNLYISENYYIKDKEILNTNNDFIIPIVGYERIIDDIVLNNYKSNLETNSVWIQYHIRSYKTNQTFLLGITLSRISNDWVIKSIEINE